MWLLTLGLGGHDFKSHLRGRLEEKKKKRTSTTLVTHKNMCRHEYTYLDNLYFKMYLKPTFLTFLPNYPFLGGVGDFSILWVSVCPIKISELYWRKPPEANSLIYLDNGEDAKWKGRVHHTRPLLGSNIPAALTHGDIRQPLRVQATCDCCQGWSYKASE